MKAVIFAGGFGTRLSEETTIKPKPMVDVGPRPILWHIMKIYASHGITDFVVLGGYKVEAIRSWFMNLRENSSDYRINLKTGRVEYLAVDLPDWNVTVLDTGLETMTGGRLKRARDIIGDDTFCLTYGDGVSDVNVTDLIAFHKEQGRMATVTAVVPPGRFGVMGLSPDGKSVEASREKASEDVGLINGGYFVCEKGVFDLIDADETTWEQEPMQRLVEMGQLSNFRHRGFWQAMDTLRDKSVLDAMWAKGKAPWKVWKD